MSVFKNKNNRKSYLEGIKELSLAMPSPSKHPGLYNLCLKVVGAEAFVVCWGTWLYDGLF